MLLRVTSTRRFTVFVDLNMNKDKKLAPAEPDYRNCKLQGRSVTARFGERGKAVVEFLKRALIERPLQFAISDFRI